MTSQILDNDSLLDEISDEQIAREQIPRLCGREKLPTYKLIASSAHNALRTRIVWTTDNHLDEQSNPRAGYSK